MNTKFFTKLNSKEFNEALSIVFIAIAVMVLVKIVPNEISSGTLPVIQNIFIFVFYSSLAVVYWRRKLSEEDVDLKRVVACFISYCIPLFIKYFAMVENSLFSQFEVGSILVIVGNTIAVLSIVSLGKSMGFLPARRATVIRGMYKIVRHPMYAGEIVMCVGLVIQRINVTSIVLFFAGIISLLFRIRWEEKVLSVLPSYQEYKAKVRYRLFPGLF
nr:methyltransferase [Candidatus Sigynarchaeota archaeon]